MKYLVDSGSMVSIIPLSATTVTVSDKPSSINLLALNNAEEKMFDKGMLSIDIGLKGYPGIDWSFIVTDSNIAILGADFLSAHNLMIDLKSKRLIERDNYANKEFHSNVKFDFISKPAPEIDYNDQCTNPELYCELVNDYPNLLTFNATAANAATDVRHVIKTHGEPIRSKVRRLSPEMLQVAINKIDRLLEAKIIRRGTSPRGSPIHLVKKKQPGQYRLTVDFRALHAVTEHDSYLLPYFNNFTNALHGSKIFSLIDLKIAFHQVPMHPNSVAKTCTVTPFGSFVWDYLPFDLRNSAQCFQRHTKHITADLDFVFGYLDDVLVCSPDEETHLLRLRKLFERFSEYSLTINLQK